jgi:hypothetical protein
MEMHLTESARSTANRLARRAHLSGRERERLRELVLWAEQEWYDAPPEPVDDRAGSAEPARGIGNVATLERRRLSIPPAEQAEAARAIRTALRRQTNRSPLDRLIPRSLRTRR